MKLHSRIYIMSILIAGMITGCSEKPQSYSAEHHSSESEITQHAEHKSDTDKSKPKSHSTDDSKPQARSADAHSHGDAELAIVLEDDVVTIELDSPIHNILGFEHAPETEAQKAALKQAELQLERGEALFAFNDKAKCKTLSDNMHVSLFDSAEDEHGHHDDGDDHDDDDHHDDDHHDDDAEHKDAKSHDDSSHDDHDEDTHKDVLLTYEFQCQSPAMLTNVNINLSEFFKELSEVDVTFLGPATQKQVTLNQNKTQMDIAP